MPEGDAELRELYTEILLDYSSSHLHKGVIEKPDFRSHGINPVCGDEIELTLSLEGEKISKLRYQGHGCVISQASAAMMAEALEGVDLARAVELAGSFKNLMTAPEKPTSLPDELEIISALEGVRKFPIRVKCATLGWNTLLQGLASRGRNGQGRAAGKKSLTTEFEEATQ